MNMKKWWLPIALVGIAGVAQAGEQVVVYNWSEYIPEDTLEKFKKETGIEVVYSTYESNETLYTKLKLMKGEGYDVVVPSTYYVSKMAKEGLLQKVDKSKLDNFKNLDTDLLNKSFDPNNEYSVPYLWGSTGIGINAADIPVDSITGWQDFWNPKFKNQLLLTDDVREVFHMALRIKGYSANTTDEAQIKEAYEYLKELMPNVRVFNSDAPREPFLSGDVSLGMIWNGSVVQAQEDNDDIQYIYPKEGAVFWMDSFVIPAGAKHVENAHKFINFMLKAEIAKDCVEYVGYATPNKAGKALLDDETASDPTIFPDAETLAAGEFHTDVGDAVLIYDKYWQLLKAGK
ncbi:MAG: extracellular solute-binding protein [Gammaproteobacteria bacterium]